jgi:hypothetical protein
MEQTHFLHDHRAYDVGEYSDCNVLWVTETLSCVCYMKGRRSFVCVGVFC